MGVRSNTSEVHMSMIIVLPAIAGFVLLVGTVVLSLCLMAARTNVAAPDEELREQAEQLALERLWRRLSRAG